MSLVRKSNGRNAQLMALAKELSDLHIEELDVDEAYIEITSKEEIKLLKNSIKSIKSIDNGDGDDENDSPQSSSKTADSSANNAAYKAKLDKLEVDNKKLKSLLEEAKEQINNLKDSSSANGTGGGGADPADLKEFQDKLSSANDKLSAANEESAVLKQKLEEKENEIKTLSSGNTAGADKADALQSKITELESKLETQKNEHEKNLEAEKEEVLTAMSEELEAAEKKHQDEIESKNSEVVQLKSEMSRLQSALAESQAGQGSINDKLKAVKRDFDSLKATQSTIKSTIHSQVDDLISNLRGNLNSQLQSKLGGIMTEYQDMIARYAKEVTERKRLHNIVQELKGNIRVYMRARPPSKKEIDQFGADSKCVSFVSDKEVKVLNEKGREKTWEFDNCFDWDSTQDGVYKEVSALVQSVLDGYAVCIFAYGQTGSGKTFTMNGPADNRGVNTRALDDLFTQTQGPRIKEGWEDVITVSVLEVYNEEIRDLLTDEQGKLDIRQGEFGNYVPGLTSVEVRAVTDLEKLMKVAEKHRSQTATNMNEHSSRSHMMLSVTVASHNKLTGFQTRGKLHLVDLAGSERLNKTGAEGKALKEAQNINKSLSALGDVIAARAKKQGHVPFRNSTLTYLLQDSLSKDSKTLMFVCCSPVLYNAEETYCSLNFAARVRSVELGVASKTQGSKANNQR